MWKLIGFVGLLILGIWGFNAYAESQAHPIPEVTANGEALEVREGSYCWDGFMNAMCADMVYTSAFEMGDREKAPALSTDDVIQFRFDRKPLPGTLTAELWSGTEQSMPIDFQNGTIPVPDQEGYYVINLSARWEQGSGNYGFGFYVNNSYEETGVVVPFIHPPALTVRAGDEVKVIEAGTSEWTYTDPSSETVSTSGIAPPRQELMASLDPLLVRSNEGIAFEFGLEPLKTDLEVWKADGSSLPISEKPDLSGFEGVTVFELTATWEQGNGQYVFALDIQN
ncbi:hypothetical protein [Planococcus lenghuensis]|uniref:Uncharacterized protein n=1 Tax=Planococcus lenghuensis TaxID=2213202 RepID=A0A1Q2KWM8_9BACL|nr:hypothetical protein [Planococcus lenghuensis]AQQ52625.1 hypothetical protein B0X71_05610 [Planococcus lenghuensis]